MIVASCLTGVSSSIVQHRSAVVHAHFHQRRPAHLAPLKTAFSGLTSLAKMSSTIEKLRANIGGSSPQAGLSVRIPKLFKSECAIASSRLLTLLRLQQMFEINYRGAQRVASTGLSQPMHACRQEVHVLASCGQLIDPTIRHAS